MPASASPPAVGFLGFGEAGFAIARGLSSAGCRSIAAYDVASTATGADGDRVRARGAEAGVDLLGTVGDLVRSREVIFCAVVAQAAAGCARQAAPHLGRRHLYVDINSCSPGVKQEVAGIVGASGASFVEAAVMGPVPAHGHRVPMLLGGPGAADFAARFAPLGMSLEVLSSEVGQASAVKMLRSVLVKGVEALLLECLLGAARYGAEARVLTSVGETFPGLDWQRLADYLLCRTAVHGERRAHEMDEVATTLRALDVEPLMARATAERLRRCAALGLSSGPFSSAAPTTYAEVLAAIRAAESRRAAPPGDEERKP